MGDSRSYIFNSEDNARVNMHIIRYLYGKMKKADIFMSPGLKSRKKSDDIGIHIGYQNSRFSRLAKGNNFRITPSEANTLAGCFNIDKEYFEKPGRMIDVHGLEPDDWKCYFCENYGGNNARFSMPENERKKRSKKVAQHLAALLSKNYVAENYDTKTPIYRIHYFFETGTAYKDPGRLGDFLKSLELLRISDWKGIASDTDSMKKHLELLKKHYEYVSAYVRCWDMEQHED